MNYSYFVLGNIFADVARWRGKAGYVGGVYDRSRLYAPGAVPFCMPMYRQLETFLYLVPRLAYPDMPIWR